MNELDGCKILTPSQIIPLSRQHENIGHKCLSLQLCLLYIRAAQTSEVDVWWINTPQPLYLMCYRLIHTHCTRDWSKRYVDCPSDNQITARKTSFYFFASLWGDSIAQNQKRNNFPSCRGIIGISEEASM